MHDSETREGVPAAPGSKSALDPKPKLTMHHFELRGKGYIEFRGLV